MNRQLARHLWPHLGAFLLYLLASTVLLGLPIHYNFRHEITGKTSTDPMVFLWWLARWPRVLTLHSNPFYTHMIWAPVGQNIAWTTCIPGLAILLWPVTVTWGPVLSFNVASITAPALAATGMYLACQELQIPWRSALLGGWLFGFSSYEFAQLLGELNLAVIWALPFILWLFLRRLHNNIGRVPYIASTAILAAFQFCVSSEIFASAVVFSSIAISLALVPDSNTNTARNVRKILPEVIVSLFISVLILSPYLYAMFSPTALYYQKRTGISTSDVMADPLNFFIPTPVLWLGTRIFGSIGNGLAAGMSDIDAYLGIPFLGIIFLYFREFRQTSRGRYLLVTLATFALLSLGDRLRVHGQITPVMLPWIIFTHLPLIRKMLPGRFAAYVAMPASLIAASWCAHSAAASWKKWGAVFLSVLFLLPNVEPMQIRGPVPEPPFFATGQYRHYIKRNEQIIVLPYGPSMWLQAATHFYFRMVGGYVGGTEPLPFSGIPVDNALNGGPLPANYKSAFRSFLKKYRVGAIVVYGREDSDLQAILGSLPLRGKTVGGVTLFNLRSLSGAAQRTTAGRWVAA